MEANHPTSRPENASMDEKRERLKSDLRERDEVSNVRDDITARNGVVFESDGSVSGDITSEVLRVLAEHDAFMPATQPNDSRTHAVLIHMES